MFDQLRDLISADPSLVNARGGDGQTPLHVASTVDIAAYLLDHGADIDARDIDHESTPAQYLIRDHQDVVRLLVSRGCHTDILMASALGNLDLVRKHLHADAESIRTTVSEDYFPKQNPRAGGHIYIWKLGHNKTPHLVAKEFGHEHVFRLLMDHTPPELKFAQACLLGDKETFKALLAAHPTLQKNLSAADQRKLVDAAQDNNTAAVALMLDAGWPVAARGQHRATALHWAAFHGNPDMIRVILSHNPPIDDADNEFHSTPVGWAIYGSEHGWHKKTGDYAGTVELLLRAGAVPSEGSRGTDAVNQVLQRHKPT
jgi:ankyrin repeat protein